MAVVVFYEKPGCSGNAQQRALLEASGHTVVARNILKTRWTRLQLLSFLKELPIPQWFNRNAPMVKRGEVNPDAFDELDATTILSLFQVHPILIRRPLIEVDGICSAGFDVDVIHSWIGLEAAFGEASLGHDFESCRHPSETFDPCAAPEPNAGHEYYAGAVR